jgi:hypothetical protein
LFVSERVYWILLITIFTTLALIIWLWLVPCQILEYNLAVNLFTSSIFMVATVISLSWLITIREKAEWQHVREEVFFRIRMELMTLFGSSVDYFEGGLELKASLMLEKEKIKNIELIGNALKNIRFSLLRKDNIAVTNFFNDLTEADAFLDSDKKISEIQGIYSKHLPANITESLMKIQHSIWALDYLRRFQGSFNLSSSPVSPFFALKDTYENIRVELLKTPLSNILSEINELYSIKELKFTYPPLA